ncbi:hypothetical protein HOLleu_31983 [Holothuria leucospilota]|uniref:Uncharacterized protein n=1 Tax=Holothuria leucospilota TaxID=206669 RepID=A0A9Q1BII4_HOLLE|nr:hypothetical protein HOLleu_31983 [Holothuria leucospilota]
MNCLPKLWFIPVTEPSTDGTTFPGVSSRQYIIREESLTPPSSMHDFEEEASNFGVIHNNAEAEVERRVNQLLIKLQTASSILSNNLCREEYLT